MQKILVVVDMQNDFIDGALGTAEAVAIVPKVAEKIKNFDGKVIFTRDTHEENYMETQEGKNLPVPHCIRGTDGWQITPLLRGLVKEICIDKPAFGSTQLGTLLKKMHDSEPIEKITFVGLCTDICVISNVLLIKAVLPEVELAVVSDCCAGVTPQSHNNALEAMKMCQIIIE